jgi:hypothetical protein
MLPVSHVELSAAAEGEVARPDRSDPRLRPSQTGRPAGSRTTRPPREPTLRRSRGTRRCRHDEHGPVALRLGAERIPGVRLVDHANKCERLRGRHHHAPRCLRVPIAGSCTTQTLPRGGPGMGPWHGAQGRQSLRSVGPCSHRVESCASVVDCRESWRVLGSRGRRAATLLAEAPDRGRSQRRGEWMT